MTNPAYPSTPRAPALLTRVAVAAVALFLVAPAAAAQADMIRASGAVKAQKIPKVTAMDTAVSASGDGLSLKTVQGAINGHRLAFTGSAPASDSGDKVQLQETATPKQGGWKKAVNVTVGSGGDFSGHWKLSVAGHFGLRAKLVPGSSGGSGQTGLPPAGSDPAPVRTNALQVQIFTTAEATLYGPGFWGNETACGERLKKGTIGVANRTLKCGTEVTIAYRGRELVAPVIDRGPYGGKASWDLTMATGKALGIDATSNIATLTSDAK